MHVHALRYIAWDTQLDFDKNICSHSEKAYIESLAMMKLYTSEQNLCRLWVPFEFKETLPKRRDIIYDNRVVTKIGRHFSLATNISQSRYTFVESFIYISG